MKPEDKLYIDLHHQETRNDVASWACLSAAFFLSIYERWAMGVGCLLFGAFFAILSVKTAGLRKRLEALMESEEAP